MSDFDLPSEEVSRLLLEGDNVYRTSVEENTELYGSSAACKPEDYGNSTSSEVCKTLRSRLDAKEKRMLAAKKVS